MDQKDIQQKFYNDLKENSRPELIKSMLVMMYFLEVEKGVIEWESFEDFPEDSYIKACHEFDPEFYLFIISLKEKFEVNFNCC